MSPPLQQQQHSLQSAVRRTPHAVLKRGRLTNSFQASTIPKTAPYGPDPWVAEQPLQLGYPGIISGQALSSGPLTSTISTPNLQFGVIEDDLAPLVSSIGTLVDLSGDEFGSSAITMTPLLRKLVRFAYEHLIPQTWPKESAKPQSSYEIAQNCEDAAIISRDTCYANAYLSLLAAALATMTGDNSLANQSRHFQSRAMTELCQRLARQAASDLITLKAILKLFSSETLFDNTSVARIFGDRGAGTDPLLEDPMKKIVADLREVFKAEEFTQNHDVPADHQLLRWRQLRKFDCISRLADHYVNLAIYPHLFHHPITQAYSCIAIALITNMVLGSPEPVRFGLKLLSDLRKKLVESASEGDAGQYRRLRLWALYVGYLGEKVHPVGEENEGWFDAAYHSLAADMGLTVWEDTKKVLRQFLYSEKLQDEIEQGRAHRMVEVRQGLYSASGCSWREPMLTTNLVVDHHRT